MTQSWLTTSKKWGTKDSVPLLLISTAPQVPETGLRTDVSVSVSVSVSIINMYIKEGK